MIKPPELDPVVCEVITAAATGDTETMHRLLARDPRLSREGYWYTPPIHFAVREGHAEIVQMLLDAGADSEANGLSGESLIELARERGHDAIVPILQKARDARGRVPPAETGGEQAIHKAAASGNLQRVRDLLDADPSLLERGDDGGATPLHRAVGASQRRVAELLLDRGANIHAIRGVPAVVTGCQTYLMERPDMLRTLLDHGMSPDTCNWQHQTMLHMLCRPQGEISKTDLECAAMLLDAGANISARDDEYRSTPLAWAARHSNLKMVKFLLSRGAPTNLPDDKPWATPLAWATRRGHKDVIDLLRAAGAAT